MQKVLYDLIYDYEVRCGVCAEKIKEFEGIEKIKGHLSVAQAFRKGVEMGKLMAMQDAQRKIAKIIKGGR